MAGWTNPLDLIRNEVLQRQDEGCAIPADLLAAIEAIPTESAWDRARIDPLYDRLEALQQSAAVVAEPNDLEGIRALRPAGPRDLSWRPDEATLLDRMHGAWTGRCVGCALGKPVEMWQRADIKSFHQGMGAWPMTGYVPAGKVGERTLGPSGSTRDEIAFMEPDDDIHYTLVGLGVLEKCGPDFTWKDVASYWAHHIPYGYICTAETQAVLNYFNNLSRMGQGLGVGLDYTATHRNPYREWIGAQIRSDGWAFACAGKPELAAEFAWRDASWTHTRTGIYGEMFLAAVQASAFVESDPRRLLEIGLSEIPADCRLARLLRQVPAWCDETVGDDDALLAKIEAGCALISPRHVAFQTMVFNPGTSAVHTLNNAAICVAAMIRGELDTRRSTILSVALGLDTDCNGASVGSACGAAAGQARFDADLARPLNDQVRPAILGFQETSMRALAERHAAVWKTVDAWHRGRKSQASQAVQAAQA